MALPNPIYIGQAAQHSPSSIRLLSYGLTAGVPGVLGVADAAIKALGTPAAAIQAMPGAYQVIARQSGGSAYEAYAGKFDVAEQVTVSPTTSSGGRTDLVILRVEDPYVTGAGTWPTPTDPVNGPYVHIRVIEGVPSNTWDVRQIDATWSAITLARIVRPASTGIVQQSHITDLRSLAELGGTRTIEINNPPAPTAPPPPIAQQVYAASVKCTANDILRGNDTAWKDFPAQASWQVPVPSWAQSMSVMATATPSSTTHVWAEVRLMINGTALTPREVDLNRAGDTVANVFRSVIPYGGVYSVPSSARGRVVTVKMQAHSAYSGGSGAILKADGPEADGKAGCYVDMWLLFQRAPG